jgi:L-lysine exporter family protein LysE/ArgO
MLFFLPPFLSGLGVGFGLIGAIGMQNAFVLKQGILKNHVLIIALLCSSLDAILIISGVTWFGDLLSKNTFILKIFHWGGIFFLFGYGIRAFYLAFTKHNLTVDDKPKAPKLKKVIVTILAVTLLNPHTYLDSCVLMASIATHFAEKQRMSFAIGACLASFIWFFLLSFGARFLRRFFEKPKSWKILDFIVGCVMFSIAISLVYSIT